MAGNYTLENEVESLRNRADELWGNIENNAPDLAFIGDELTYIATRAEELANAAYNMNGTLSALVSTQTSGTTKK